VDLWHCNVPGKYSDEQSEGTLGQKWLRGYQVTDAHGNARFITIYPGYYQGRTVHIHAKIHLDANSELTTQFYFSDDLTDTIYADKAPYNTRGARNTRNTGDSVLGTTDDGEGIHYHAFIEGKHHWVCESCKMKLRVETEHTDE
jgi:protocatechuate 3,4-dioxygenase beta subunit